MKEVIRKVKNVSGMGSIVSIMVEFCVGSGDLGHILVHRREKATNSDHAVHGWIRSREFFISFLMRSKIIAVVADLAYHPIYLRPRPDRLC